jgi:hypothetical protein
MFLDRLELDNQELEKKEEEFESLLLNESEAEAVLKELQGFFANLSFEDSVKKYKTTYWRWYTELTWDRLNGLSEQILVNIAIGQQVPTALLLGINVWQDLMRYFLANNYLENNVESLYIKVKKSFQESKVTVGVWKGSDITVADLVKEAKEINKRNDSLAEAEFENKLKQIMLSNDWLVQEYAAEDSDDAAGAFIELIAFFETFTEENIWFVVDSFINPEKYQNGAGEVPSAAPKPAASERPVSKSVPTTPPKPVISSETISKPPVLKPTVSTKPTLQETRVVEPQVRPTTAQIKSEIESQFKKDDKGNFEDIETVLAMLSTLSEKYNDPKIADMMYFDEKENKFKWNT